MEEALCVRPKKYMGSRPSKSKKKEEEEEEEEEEKEKRERLRSVKRPVHATASWDAVDGGGHHTGQHTGQHSGQQHASKPQFTPSGAGGDCCKDRPRRASTEEDDGDSMPLFKKQNPEAKKRLQHQMYLAKESPEPSFDVSDCEISDVPPGVFSLCKVLQKQVLLLHNNWLTSLKGGGNLRDLAGLRILDLHRNDLSSLPDDIHLLSSLQILNVEQNKLKSLPAALAQLTALQTLNLKGNKLKTLPECVCRLESLRTLDITGNPHLSRLPADLAGVRTLESLVLDAHSMHHPPQGVCIEGTVAIMQQLCEESGRTYVSPAKVLLAVLDPPPHAALSPSHSSSTMKPADIIDVADVVAAYEQQKERKRQERILLEQRLEEEQRQQAQLALQAARNKQHLITYLSKEGARIDSELSVLQQQKEREHAALVDTMKVAEANATLLTEQLTVANATARTTEELWEQLESERRTAEEWWKVRAEEVMALRRAEVLSAMEHSLKEHAAAVDASDHRRHLTEQVLQQREEESDGRLNNFMSSQQVQHDRFVDYLIKEERVQREAFASLQQAKDARHARLTGQIGLIEQELAQLSRLELQERQLKVNMHMSMLAEKRAALTRLLVQLMDERRKREAELMKRLLEMEERRVDSESDYWLVQYQRLMDRKPTALIDEKKNLEFAVSDILERAGAGKYVPLFARHRITIETMCQLGEKDIQQMGVSEVGLQKAIVREIQAYLQEEEQATAKAKNIESPDVRACPGWCCQEWLVCAPKDECSPRETPSAPLVSPSAEHPQALESPATTPPEVTAHFNSECVICMEQQSCVLLLNCGHVCCCKKCSESVHECPLCRGEILSRIDVSSALLQQHLPQ